MSNYTNEAQQRLLRIVLALAGKEWEGIKPNDLAKSLGVTAATITRDLANLKEAGWVETIDGLTAVRLTPRVGQISTTVQDGLNRVHRRLDEFQQRYSRTL